MQDYCLRQMCPIGLMENSGQKINIEMAKRGPQGQNTALLSILMCKIAYLSCQESLIPQIMFFTCKFDPKMILTVMYFHSKTNFALKCTVILKNRSYLKQD